MRLGHVYKMISEKTYYITLGRLKWRWMYEDETEGKLTEERRKALMETDEIGWYEHFMIPFKAI